MDDDDLSLSYRLSSCLEVFLKHPEIDVVGSNIVMLIHEGGYWYDQPKLPEFHEAFKFQMIGANELQHSSVMYRLERLRGKTFYNYIGAEDYDLWFRLLFETKDPEPIFYMLQFPVAGYRFHPNRISEDPAQKKSWSWAMSKQKQHLKEMFPAMFGEEEPDYLLIYAICDIYRSINSAETEDLEQYPSLYQRFISHYEE